MQTFRIDQFTSQQDIATIIIDKGNTQISFKIDRQIDSLLITDLQLKVELYDYLQKIEY